MSTLTARKRGDGKGSSRRFTYPTTHRCVECGTVVRLVFIPGPTERVYCARHLFMKRIH
jgi:hypothetical protein